MILAWAAVGLLALAVVGMFWAGALRRGPEAVREHRPLTGGRLFLVIVAGILVGGWLLHACAVAANG